MSYKIYSVDEFSAALDNCEVPVYSGFPYLACWLTPDGKVAVSSDGHYCIAQDIVLEKGFPRNEYDLYVTLYRNNYFRLIPYTNRRVFSINGTGTLSSRQKAVISAFLRLWKVQPVTSDWDDASFVERARDDDRGLSRSHRRVGSRKEFIAAIQEFFS